MPATAFNILLVEDEPSIRSSMSLVLAEFGYVVRCAEDGFSALREIRREMPDILLSDLNMPGMSGFELLSVVRQRFPLLRTLAMSGAYSGGGVPPGIIADAFYPKGSGVKVLLETLQTLAETERQLPPPSGVKDPLWIHRSDNDSSLEACVTIVCPECLRTFSLTVSAPDDRMHAAKCLHCNSPIHFAIAPSEAEPSLSTLHDTPVKCGPKVATQYYD